MQATCNGTAAALKIYRRDRSAWSYSPHEHESLKLFVTDVNAIFYFVLCKVGRWSR